MIDCNVISTGSKGNAVVIDGNILTDVGVPFAWLRGVYKSLALVMVTHFHGDHFNAATVRKLAVERPTLRFAAAPHMVPHLLAAGVHKAKIDVLESDKPIVYRNGMTVSCFPLHHNVPNVGWRITLPDERRVMYATDTNRINHITCKDYDLYLLEANYREAEITERIRRKLENGEYCYEYDVLNNHLSYEKAMAWIADNSGNTSEYILLHGHNDTIE